MLFDGVHLPLATPFYPDGDLYLRKLEHNVRRYSLTPVQGLVALSDVGESASLSTEEKREVLRTVAQTAAAEKVLTAVVSEAGVLPALKLMEYAAELNYDAVLLQAPFPNDSFWWPESGLAAELLVWFQSIADRSPLPLLLASQVGGCDLPIEVLASLTDHPNVIGVVEQSEHIGRVADLKRATAHIQRSSATTITFTAATGRMLLPAQRELSASATFVSAQSLAGGVALAEVPTQPALKTRTKQTGLQVLWAHGAHADEALRAGAGGLLPEIAAAVPQAVFEIWAAWKDGDVSLLEEKQRRVAEAEPFFTQGRVAALKAGSELSGYFGGRPRLPHLSLTREKQDRLATLLAGMRS